MLAWARRRSPEWFLAVVCWAPFLVPNRGIVSADTKTYLTIDPARVLSEATHLWNPNVGLGTVTHQYVGFLWPMGPYYWLCDLLGIADWVAQRLWWGALLWIAAAGTRRLARDLGLGGAGSMIAALAYGLSPYPLQYLARLSGLLLAWAALPWMLLWVRRLRQDASWMPPLTLAVIVASAGTMNASALLLVGLGPAVWLIVDVAGGRLPRRTAAVFLARFTSLSALLNAWWIWALVVQGRFGLPILRYTETYETVAKASSPLEILRGLGYWFFYGGDLRDRWVDASATFMQNRIVLLAGLGLVAVSLAALAGLVRSDRSNLAAMALVGLGVSVASAPIGDSGPFGRAFLHLVRNEAGFALRSTPRAAPVVLLCLAVGAGTAADAAIRRRSLRSGSQWSSAAAVGGLCVAIAVQANPHFSGRFLTDAITRPERLPAHVIDAAAAIDAAADDTGWSRVYEFPGTDFATHDWGGTVDPVMASLTSSSYLARELVPYGSDGTADLLDAHESRLQEAIAGPGDLASFARLISATAVAWRADLDYAAYRTPRPEQVAASVRQDPPGGVLLRAARGEPEPLPRIVDEQTYALGWDPDPPAYQVWQISGHRTLADAAPLGAVAILSGDGRGLLAAIRAGVMSPLQTTVYAASHRLDERLSGLAGGHVVLTDTNRRSPRRWYSVYSNLGRTEPAGVDQLFDDPSDNRLFPFLDDPRADPTSTPQAVTRYDGDIEWVRSTQSEVQAYHTPEDRPENAFDEDPRTSWRTAALAPATGRGFEVRLRRMVAPTHVDITLPTEGLISRRIRTGRLVLRATGAAQPRTVSFRLGFGTKHRIALDGLPFDRLRLIVDSDNLGPLPSYDGIPALGLAELAIPGVVNTEWLALPEEPAAASAARLSVVLERWRTEPSTVNRADPEVVLARIVTLPRTVSGMLSGEVAISALADEDTVSAVLGLPQADSDARLNGTWRSTAGFAVDGRASTGWITDFDPAGRSVLRVPLEVSDGPLRRLRMQVDTSVRHSIPTRVTVSDVSGRSWTVRMEPAGGELIGDLPAGVTSPITSLRIDAVETRVAPDYFTGVLRTLPVRILEVDAGTRRVTSTFPASDECREDLLFLDGRPVAIRIAWTTTDAGLPIRGRYASCTPVDLPAGEVRIRSANGRDTGVDVNSFVLSEPGASVESTALEVTSLEPTRVVVQTIAAGPHVVSFAQSINKGWRAIHDDGTDPVDLGRPFVVQGYANGWIVPGPGTVTLEWTPQAGAAAAQMASLLGGVGSGVGILAVGLRRRRHRTRNRQIRAEVPVDAAAMAGPRVLFGAGVASWGVLVGVVAFGGAVAALCVLPAVFLPRRLVARVVAGAFTALAIAVIWSQGRYGHQATLDWPGHFWHLVAPTWIAFGWALVALVDRRTTDEAR